VNEQPQIRAGLAQLATGYEHGGLRLDLFGTSERDGIEVEDVALAGQRVSLAALFSASQLESMGAWCERQAEREAAQLRKDNRIDAAYLRMMRPALPAAK